MPARRDLRLQSRWRTIYEMHFSKKRIIHEHRTLSNLLGRRAVARPAAAGSVGRPGRRRPTASGKKDGGISRITDGKSPNGESRVPQPFAGTEIPGEKRLPAATSRQTEPETETAFNPAGPETKHSGYGQATAAYAPATEPFPAIQKPVDPTRRQNGSGYGSQNETSPYPQRSGNDDERGSSRLSEESRRAIRETVNERLSELRVYVLESDITEAQQAVKSVVEQASF